MLQTNMPTHQTAESFLSVAKEFQLENLPTEKPHPRTAHLSDLAKDNLTEALAILQKIDSEMLATLTAHTREIQDLARAIHETIAQNHKVYLCGCGSTGRLALTLESIWAATHSLSPLRHQVTGFMAGGDTALIKSIAHFEDYAEYGKKQLEELGFGKDDLLIACTEAGETSFVIGATLYAAQISRVKPFFLYCNPDDILCALLERSRQIIRNDQIRKINCSVGPMALAGSTRMQASSILLAAVGIALSCHDRIEYVPDMIEILQKQWYLTDLTPLKDLISLEAAVYSRSEYIIYEVDDYTGITVLTDTTERAPTFGLDPFENSLDQEAPLSLCYLLMPQALSASDAWQRILHRKPRALHWLSISEETSSQRMDGFDFSRSMIQRRALSSQNAKHTIIKIFYSGQNIHFESGSFSYELPCGNEPVIVHLLLKMILNSHSTLVMGRINRYDHNLMTWVRPTNNKLIDRTIRYIRLFLESRNIRKSYEDIAHACFTEMENIRTDESLVHTIMEHFGSTV